MTTSKTITDVTVKLAAYELYISRGLVDQQDTRYNQLLMHKETAEGKINDILAGRIWIDAERRGTITYPTVEP